MRVTVLLVLAGIIIISRQVNFSDADFTVRQEVAGNSFRAAVLDFTSGSAASGEKLASLFRLEELIPGGQEVKMVRLAADTTATKLTSIKYVKTSKDGSLCDEINLVLLHHWKKIYTGALVEFVAEVESSSAEDLVFVLARKEAVAAGGQCFFDLVFQQGQENSGFFARRTLTNFVVSQ